MALAIFPAPAAEFGISTSTYLGDGGDSDATRGLRIAADGTVVAAVNLGGADPGNAVTVRTLLNGATPATPGAIVRFAPDGKTVLSITRLAAAVHDLALDAADNLYLAAGTDGIFKLNPAADTILWHHLPGTFVYRCDAGPSGSAVALAPTSPANLEGNSGPGTIHVIDPAGTPAASFPGRHNTQDVAIDEASATIVFTGYRVTSSFGPPGDSSWNPVHIPYARGTDLTIRSSTPAPRTRPSPGATTRRPARCC